MTELLHPLVHMFPLYLDKVYCVPICKIDIHMYTIIANKIGYLPIVNFQLDRSHIHA